MIYNENGMILNEDYILKEYFNNSIIDDIINESFNIGKGIRAAIDWLINKVKEFGQWLINIPNRMIIKKNKDKIKETLSSIKYSENNKIVSVKLKGEIAKYIGSNGYTNGKWIETFTKVCKDLQSNTNITKESIENTLYKGNSEDNWFSNDKLKSINTLKLNTDEIVDFAINVSELSKPLKQAHNELIKFNKKLEKDNKINIEVLNTINHYFKQSMVSIRNLSYACITVCMNAYKGKTSESIEKGMVFDNKSAKYRHAKENNDTNSDNGFNDSISNAKKAGVDDSKILKNKDDIDNYFTSEDKEKAQLAAVEKNPWAIKYIENPSEKVQTAAVVKKPSAIQDIENPSEKVQLIAVEEDPLSIKYIENPSEKVQTAAVEKEPWTIEYIKNPSEKLQLIAVEKDPYVIQYIENPSEKAQLAVVEKDSWNIEYIKNPSEKLQLIAVEKDPSAIQCIKNPSKKVQNVAVKKAPSTKTIYYHI